MVLGGKHRQVPIKHFYYEFRNISRLPFLLLWLLYQQRQHPVEWFDKLARIKHHFSPSFGGGLGMRE